MYPLWHPMDRKEFILKMLNAEACRSERFQDYVTQHWKTLILDMDFWRITNRMLTMYTERKKKLLLSARNNFLSISHNISHTYRWQNANRAICPKNAEKCIATEDTKEGSYAINTEKNVYDVILRLYKANKSIFLQ